MGDVTEVVSLMKSCLLSKNEASTLRDSQKEQKVSSYIWCSLKLFIFSHVGHREE